MPTRIDSDLRLVCAAHPNAIIGANSEYFILPAYNLPVGVFDRETTRLLVVIPPTYAAAPPDNFYTQWGLSLAHGAKIENYSGPAKLFGEQWGVFSFHADGEWNATSDSLLTFLTAVRQRLQEGA